jgi:hypothetical protein
MLEFLNTLFESAKTSIFSNQFFGGAFWLSIMAAVFYQLKTVPLTIWNLIEKHIFFTAYFDENDRLFFYFEHWLDHYYKNKYRRVELSLSFGKKLNIPIEKDVLEPKPVEKESKKIPKVYQKQLSDTFIIWYKKTPIYIFKGREKLENAQSLDNIFLNHYKLIGIRSKKIINRMIKEVLDFNTEENIKNKVYFNNKLGDWCWGGERVMRSENTIFLKPGIKETIFKRLDEFIINKDWYQEKGIPYKIGLLLKGPPGNGKTTLFKAIAGKYKREIHYMNLHDYEMSDSGLRNAFRSLNDNSLLIIEDIDSYFEEKRKLRNDKISFTSLINCLDGVLSPEGVIMIFTTNKELDLDPALLRPGRIDFQVEIPKPSIIEVRGLYKHIFEKDLNLDNLRNGHSMAEIQNVFLSNLKTPEKIKELI